MDAFATKKAFEEIRGLPAGVLRTLVHEIDIRKFRGRGLAFSEESTQGVIRLLATELREAARLVRGYSGHGHCGVEIARSVIAQLPMTCPMRSDVADAAVVSSGIGLHLAIFVEPFLGAVIEGRKTIESRFAKNRCAPYLRIGEGDIVFLKKSGGTVLGVAKVGIPQFHELDALTLSEIRDRHASEICAEEDSSGTNVEKRSTRRSSRSRAQLSSTLST